MVVGKESGIPSEPARQLKRMHLAEVTSRFLDPIFKLEDEEYWALLSACATDSHVLPMVAAQVLSGKSVNASPHPSFPLIADAGGSNIHCGRSAPWESPVDRIALGLKACAF